MMVKGLNYIIPFYKLTDENWCTPDGLQWGPQVTHELENKAATLISHRLFAYLSPQLAVFMNPVHNGIMSPRLWEVSGDIIFSDGLRIWMRSLTTIREIPMPEITATQHVAFAILASKAVYHDPDWQLLAEKWLSGEDRSAAAFVQFNSQMSEPSIHNAAAKCAAGSAIRADLIAQTGDDDRRRDNYSLLLRYHSAHAAMFANFDRQTEKSPDFVSIANEAMKY